MELCHSCFGSEGSSEIEDLNLSELALKLTFGKMVIVSETPPCP